MEFRNQAITDILMVLAAESGRSIIPDETVSGSASFLFTDSEFEAALTLFLSTYRLHYVKNGNVYYVSRIASSFDRERGLVSLAADEVDLTLLVRSLSKTIGETILFDSLPRETLTVNIESVPPEKALEILMKRFPDYSVENEASYRYIKRKLAESGNRAASAEGEVEPIAKNGDSYTLNLEKGRFIETLVELFAAAGREYSLLTKADSQLENLYFSERSFDELLRLLLEQGNADYVVSGGVYYITELQRRDVVKKLKKTEILALENIQVQELPNLLPAELSSGNAFRVDKSSNRVILSGTEEETKPIVDFIKLVDRPLMGRSYVRFDAKHLKAKDLLQIIPTKLLPIAPITLPDSNSFIALTNEQNRVELERFIAMADRQAGGFSVRLRYLKNEDFLKVLPPSVAKEDIVDSGYPGLLFFTGSEEKWRNAMRELELIDRPKPQIRYELLVIQFQRSKNLEWSRDFQIKGTDSGAGVSFLGGLANIFSLNFDVVSQFGYLFATNLSLQLTEKTASIFADTTLNGLSGQDVKFQNTTTSRYRESETDEDTGEVKLTGVTREITSGLMVGLNGWVSGNGMVTMTVSATVSKQSDSGSGAADLPTTTERVIATQIRTTSGNPIVIGGLKMNDADKKESKFPILGNIPLIGYLFKDETASTEDSEIVLYIVPHVGWGENEEAKDGLAAERYYRNYVKDFIR